MKNFEPNPKTLNTTENQPEQTPTTETSAPQTGNAEKNPIPATDENKPVSAKGEGTAPTSAESPAAKPLLTVPANGAPPYWGTAPKIQTLSMRVREAILKTDNGHKAIGLFAGVLVICLFLANTLLNTGGAGFFFPFCVVLLYSAFYAFTGFDKLFKNREALAMQIFIFLLSLGFLYNQERLTNTVTFLTLLAAVPIHLMYCTGKSDSVKDGARVIRKAFCAVFPYTFGNIDVPYRKLLKGVHRGAKGKGVLYAVLGLLCTIPFLVVFTMLFSSADSAFAQSLSGLTNYFMDFPVAKIVGTVIIGVLMTAYILPLFFTLDTDYPQLEERGKRKGILPNSAVTAFLAVLIALEAYFSYFQVRYLFLNLGSLPEGTSYAEYARSGFFEIAAATLLTMALIFAVTVLTRRDEQEQLPLPVRVLLTVFAACVALMFASSYYRMLMYMDVYSMTIRRVGVCWLMALLLAVLLGVIIYIWKPDFALTRYTIFTALVFVLALNLMHLGGTVSKNNVDHYFKEQAAEVKTGYQLDTDYLYTLLPASAPDLVRLQDTPAYEQNYPLQSTLNSIRERDYSWRAWSYDLYRAKKACAELEDPDDSLWVTLYISPLLETPIYGLEFEYALETTPTGSGLLEKADGSAFKPGETMEFKLSELDPIPEGQDLSRSTFRFFVVLEDGSVNSAKDINPDYPATGGKLSLYLEPNDEYDFTVTIG